MGLCLYMLVTLGLFWVVWYFSKIEKLKLEKFFLELKNRPLLKTPEKVFQVQSSTRSVHRDPQADLPPGGILENFLKNKKIRSFFVVVYSARGPLIVSFSKNKEAKKGWFFVSKITGGLVCLLPVFFSTLYYVTLDWYQR